LIYEENLKLFNRFICIFSSCSS